MIEETLMTDSDPSTASLNPSQNEVRQIRLGLRSKLLVAFTGVLTLYALISSVYLLRYFFDDKARYVLFSLHQSADSTCTKLSIKKKSPDELNFFLKQIDTGSSIVFNAKNGSVIAESLSSDVNAQDLWKSLNQKTDNGTLTIFTAEHTQGQRRFFISACRFNSKAMPLWLVLVADAKEALAPANALLLQMAGLFLILLLSGLGIFYIIAQGLTKPLSALTSFADDLGAGNYKRKIQVAGSDELGVLADSFSILSGRLESRESELEKSTELANQDFLTGLWNRRYFERRAQEHFVLAKRHSNDMALIYLDADYFKKINDTYGHQAGDDVLVDFAKLIKSELRQTDFVARIGGEEFIMVLPQTNIQGAVRAAEKLRTVIKNHNFLGEKKIKLTASMGVASIGDHPTLTSAHALTEAADKFAYHSKASGRDRISSTLGQVL